MPELPEVERGRRLAERVAQGRLITGVSAQDDAIVYQGLEPSDFADALMNRRVQSVCRRGKQLWFRLEGDGPHPLFHFGMTGAFEVPGEAGLELAAGLRRHEGWPPRFSKLQLHFDDGGALSMTNARRLGRILLREDPENEAPIAKLGFDALIDAFDKTEFSARLRQRRGIIKNVLLNQSFAAGVGNWIADEILYQAKIDPRRNASSLDDQQAQRIGTLLVDIITKACAVDAEKSRLPTSWLFHHRWGKKGDARTAKGERILFVEIGGRTSAWVPEVQI